MDRKGHATPLRRRTRRARYIFGDAGQQSLRDFASSNGLLAVDYDGTLAPIVDEPADAIMTAATKKLLRRAASMYPCVVLSGRKQVDLALRIRGTGVLVAVGYDSHWIHESHSARRVREQVKGWRRQLDWHLKSVRGVFIEDKEYALTVHFQPSDALALAKVRQVVGSSSGARVVPGTRSCDIVASGVASKADMLVQLQRQCGCDNALYIGDDFEDEDVFELSTREPLLGVRVRQALHSHAQFFLVDQPEVDRLLARLIEFRRR